ncbi:MAG: carbonate dehydratase [Rhodoferax sp.]
MPTTLAELFAHNRAWAAQMQRQQPDFFTRLAQQQSPRYMWIGCSDSRVPANQITGLAPGEVFVHRNVANVVVPSDLNCLSAVQYAVDQLKVEHLIVVGHYGCGGVRAALEGLRVGLADNWLQHVRDVHQRHAQWLARTAPAARLDLLCELNVVSQVLNLARCTVVQDAWSGGQKLSLHGWIYGLQDGLLRDLGMTLHGSQQLTEVYARALDQLAQSRA